MCITLVHSLEHSVLLALCLFDVQGPNYSKVVDTTPISPTTDNTTTQLGLDQNLVARELRACLVACMRPNQARAGRKRLVWLAAYTVRPACHDV